MKKLILKKLDRFWTVYFCWKYGHRWETIWGTNYAECIHCQKKTRV